MAKYFIQFEMKNTIRIALVASLYHELNLEM